ncbi:right-handed parallel beta-helix repeat-containing protein [Acuticoccus mangrovi]|uniref:Right-handed parallel beta-helix repeat-containing protein n=1 Tax=Acuticoccus mangrovi TaxID=2796142 RepID=A0A934MG13_9HYPH|nr:right-handed parallel beta-helix repeat-containing protein [Acuticoccus mangrovi]MBJ3775495.1 right-handed parallel beta-helix repeat-containing protein [Acuticoccus mangrovi]
MQTFSASDPAELRAAIAAAAAYLATLEGEAEGCRILVHPGPYHEATDVVGLKGRVGAPVVFEGGGGVICGGSHPDPQQGYGRPQDGGPGNPTATDFAFLRFSHCEHVVVAGFELQNYWPVILYFQKSSHITIIGNTLRHGTNAVFAKQGRGFGLEGNRWQQDDTPEHVLWHEVDWIEAHGGDGGMGTKRYYNGSFFASKDVSEVNISRNVISDCYNGVRMKVGQLPGDAGLPYNRDVYIFDNDFVRVRDNPIEPEYYVHNWHIAHNRIVDAHSWFSLDGVRGGYMYIYGNTAHFVSRQGVKDATHHTMGRVLKLSYASHNPDYALGAAVPDHPWYVVHNSFVLRCPIVGGAADEVPQPPCDGVGPDYTANLTCANNAFEWCSIDEHGIYLCEWIAMLRSFSRRQNDGVVFDHNLSNRRDYFDQARSLSLGEAGGLHADAPFFVRPAEGDFTLVAESPGRGRAEPMELEAPDGRRLRIRPGEGGALHRGAIQDYGHAELEEVVSV